eukprot:gnl/TRDRNA2_/TRDRNA2_176359_c1_seq2.p1 gnl/TRDRNA2_/TRDRNA2_176359_c1~~gnl/TRDRNA2_/TRDRNA2_176359_c1_seq2.p1  ORF type:complete len:1083 (+),score=188.25 gnl/TRDRNA2_/TRDRNA2_176359_c1_seq2:358-3249(+)
MAAPASGQYRPFVEPKCLNVTEKAAPVCCADWEKPYIHIHPQDLSERKPPTPLTIKSAVWAVSFKTKKGFEMCLHISGGVLVAHRCKWASTLFASSDGELLPWEENSGTPMRTHLCLEAAEDSITTKSCTEGTTCSLTLADSGKLFAGDSGKPGAKCLTYDDSGERSFSDIILEADETKCGQWLFHFKHRISTSTFPPKLKSLMDAGDFDDDAADEVVQILIEQAKEEVGDAVSGSFWTWLASVEGMQLSLASTSFPIHPGTVLNLYQLWLYFGVDWDDSMASFALATAFRGRDRNVVTNEVAFDMHRGSGIGEHRACGHGDDPKKCPFPGFRGHVPKGGEFMEYYLEKKKQGAKFRLDLFEGKRGAPWALMMDWNTVPLDECSYHDNNGWATGEYTFRYGRTEIRCKQSDWYPESAPRIAEDGGVCGRLSYLDMVKYTCSGLAPSRGVGQPGHAAGLMYAGAGPGTYSMPMFWSIYDERVSTAAWIGLSGGAKNVQWHKTIPTTLAMADGRNRYEKSKLAAMVALRASYWQESAGSVWMQQSLYLDPYNIEVWDYYRQRIEQGKYDEAQTMYAWTQFKKVFVMDSPTPFHALTEKFFNTVVNTRSCDQARLTWQIAEKDELFRIWKLKRSNFDINATFTVFTLHELTCAIVLQGFRKVMADDVYNTTLMNLLNSKTENNNAVHAPKLQDILDIFLASDYDRDEKVEALEWAMQIVRPGLLMWDLFGVSYFAWMKTNRIMECTEGVGGSMNVWVTNHFTKMGEDDRMERWAKWQESCLTEPWKHTKNNARGILFDGCYYGKNGAEDQITKFFDWFIPYHESNGTNDTCFPDWALEKLRQSGAALTQSRNGTNGTDENEFYEACLAELKDHGATDLSERCRLFIQRLTVDDESGRAAAVEGSYIFENTDEKTKDEEDKDPEMENEFVAESLDELPDWLQKKFEAAKQKKFEAALTMHAEKKSES